MEPTEHEGICRIKNDDIVLSVVLNYFEKASTVFDAIDHLQKQSLSLCCPEQIEILVVDDGSAGEPIGNRLPKNVTYIWQRKFRYGLSRAKNTGAKLANGRYLVFLDADIMVNERFVDAVIRGFKIYGDRVVQAGYIEDYWYVGAADPRVEIGVWENPEFLSRRFYQIMGGNLAIAKSLYLATPGFDEDLIYGGVEDLVFGYHLSLLPATGVYFNRGMEVRHIPHPPGLNQSNPETSWAIAKRKYPRLYDEYVAHSVYGERCVSERSDQIDRKVHPRVEQAMAAVLRYAPPQTRKHNIWPPRVRCEGWGGQGAPNAIHYSFAETRELLGAICRHGLDQGKIFLTAHQNGLPSMLWENLFDEVVSVYHTDPVYPVIREGKHTIFSGRPGPGVLENEKFLRSLEAPLEGLRVMVIDENYYPWVMAPYFLFKKLMRPSGMVVFMNSANRRSEHLGTHRFLSELRSGYHDNRKHEIVDLAPDANGFGVSYELI